MEMNGADLAGWDGDCAIGRVLSGLTSGCSVLPSVTASPLLSVSSWELYATMQEDGGGGLGQGWWLFRRDST